MEGAPETRRWWQRSWARLSLRALMLLVLVLACGLGWFANSVRVQREAIQAIEKLGGHAFYDWQLKRIVTPDFEDRGSNNPGAKPAVPQWIVDRFGPDYYSTAHLVMFAGEADAVMPHIAKLSRLEELDLFPKRKGTETSFGVTDAGMVYFRDLTNLRHLKLGINSAQGSVGSKITGKGLAEIAGCTRLQILELQGIPLKDVDLATLEGMADLRMLSIETPDVTDAGLDHLAALTELRDLILQGTGVTSEGVKRLRGLTKLKKLDLSLSKVTTIENLRSLDHLEMLWLARTPIGDDGLAAASGPGFASLSRLGLFHTQVTDVGLMHLQDLPKLKSVDVMETAVTDEGVAAFKKVRPNVNVSRQRPPATPRPRPGSAPPQEVTLGLKRLPPAPTPP